MARAVALQVPGLRPVPQVTIRRRDGSFLARVDLADESLGIVIEAESFTFHASERHLLERDCVRYDELACLGWLVLRFTWDQLMNRQGWVVATILAAVQRRREERTAPRRR